MIVEDSSYMRYDIDVEKYKNIELIGTSTYGLFLF